MTGLVVAIPVAAQDVSGLQEKELRRLEDVPAAAWSLLTDLTGVARGLRHGRIERLVVTDDREGRLSIRIDFSGFVEADLVGLVLDGERVTARSISRPKVQIDSTAVHAEMVFELEEGVPEGTTFESAYLRLEVHRRNHPVPARSLLYAMPKRWAQAIAAENVVVQVTPTAIGAAARVSAASPPWFRRGAGAAAPTSEAGRPERGAKGAEPPLKKGADVAPDKGRGATPTKNPRVTIPPPPQRVDRAAFRPGMTREQADRGWAGPGARPVDLLDRLQADVQFDLAQLRGIPGGLSALVHQDRNPLSGVFYFLPRDFHLRWDPDDGYGLNILYRTGADGPADGQVQMSAHLDAGISTGDLDVLAALLEAYARHHRLGVETLQLQRMPLDSSPRLSFSEDLTRLYDIPAERIQMTTISDALGDMTVSWVTDARIAADMQIELVKKGIQGQAIFDPQGEAVPQALPVEVSLRDPRTYGVLPWSRNLDWRNRTPYPVIVKRLHALLLDARSDLPTVFSWDLGNAVVPPRARLAIDAGGVAPWVDSVALRMWIEYSVSADCEPCDHEAITRLRGGAIARDQVAIVFHTLTPLADLGAALVTVQVRSRFLHPQSRSVQAAADVILSADGQQYTAGPVYPPRAVDAPAASVEPLFEYLLSVVMPDGTVHAGVHWMASGRPTVFIGKAQVEQSLGFLPGGAARENR